MASRGIKGDLFQTPDAPVVELVEPPRLVERPYRKKRLRALERPVHPRQVEALPDDALAPIFRNSRLFMSFSLCAKVCKKRGGLSNRGGCWVVMDAHAGHPVPPYPGRLRTCATDGSARCQPSSRHGPWGSHAVASARSEVKSRALGRDALVASGSCMGLHPPRHGPARAVPAPPSAQGVPDTGCRRGRPPRPPTSVLTHEGSDVGRGARPARPSGLTHRIRLPDVPYRGRAAEDVGPYHRFRPTDRSPLRPTDRSAVRPTDHRPVRCVIRPCSRRGFGDERDFASERSKVKSRSPSSLGTTRGVPGAGCPTRPPRRS